MVAGPFSAVLEYLFKWYWQYSTRRRPRPRERRAIAMRVLVGSFTTDYGTVELSAAGGDLVYSGPDPEHVRAIVESERQWYDRSGIEYTLTDEELLRSLPYRLQGYIVWAVSFDEQTGLTLDQPPYDPWGDMWRSEKAKPDPERRPLVAAVPVEAVAREAAQREWNQRAAEWVQRVKERAKAQRKVP
jgi:hypothetical protein